MQISLDTDGGKAYASRNFNDIRHTWAETWGQTRSNVDFTLVLRQLPRHARVPPMREKKFDFNANRVKKEMTNPPEEGPYNASYVQDDPTQPKVLRRDQSVAKYQNMADTIRMVKSLNCSRCVDWQLNLRDSQHQKPDVQFHRYFSRTRPTFEQIAVEQGIYTDSYRSRREEDDEE